MNETVHQQLRAIWLQVPLMEYGVALRTNSVDSLRGYLTQVRKELGMSVLWDFSVTQPEGIPDTVWIVRKSKFPEMRGVRVAPKV